MYTTVISFMCSFFPDYVMCTCPKGHILLHKRIVHAPVLHSDLVELIDNVIHNNVTKHQLQVHTCLHKKLVSVDVTKLN